MLLFIFVQNSWFIIIIIIIIIIILQVGTEIFKFDVTLIVHRR